MADDDAVVGNGRNQFDAAILARCIEIEESLIRGLESGPPREMTCEDWDELKRPVGKREFGK